MADRSNPRPAAPSIDARRPNQKFQRFVEGTKSVGNSNYHALQIRAERRLSAGLTFLTSYTWSKAMSGPHDQGGLIGNGGFIGSPQDYYNMRNLQSDTDMRAAIAGTPGKTGTNTDRSSG